ncbi:2-keto-4-pentenoate hydratase (plasmid) [Microvirga sp. RSM25]|uniref:2-keto-4-pentenoate hydratase n=1 Tax=Microvirga sp. RSM25 TaxID=3273802 RepID=UPI0038509FB6
MAEQATLLDRQVEFFLNQRLSPSRLAEVPAALKPADADSAYAVLAGVHAGLAATGHRRVGYKIGCTTSKTQAAQRTDHPTWAGLFEADRYRTIGGAIRNIARPFAIECEIVMLLGKDIDDPAALSDERLTDAIQSCAVGCELVVNRYGDPLARGLPTLIADDFFQAAFVVGPPNDHWRNLDLSKLAADVRVDGRVVETGVTSTVMGNPLHALRWLVADQASRGMRLHAGDIIFSGSATTPYWLDEAPHSVEIRIEALGSLT